jgi:hypothetical protein
MSCAFADAQGKHKLNGMETFSVNADENALKNTIMIRQFLRPLLLFPVN